MTKRLMALVALLLSFTLVAAACGSDDDEAGGDGDGLRVGLVFDVGGRGDGTFNDSAARGAAQAASELGVEVVELEAVTEDDRQPHLETLAGDGITTIVANGFAFGDAVAAVMNDNPDVIYAVTDGFIPDAPENVVFMGFAEHEGSFLVGAAAALACECESIGFIGGQEIGLIEKFEVGYTEGALYVNPDITVEVQYLGPDGDVTAWSSPEEAQEIANAWFADGVGVVYTAAGGSGQGAHQAAADSGAWSIGVDSDEALTAPEAVQGAILTSMVKNVDAAVFDVYSQAQAGTLTGGFLTYDLASGGVGYTTTNGHLDDHVDQLEEIKAMIIAGDIVVTDPTAG